MGAYRQTEFTEEWHSTHNPQYNMTELKRGSICRSPLVVSLLEKYKGLKMIQSEERRVKAMEVRNSGNGDTLSKSSSLEDNSSGCASGVSGDTSTEVSIKEGPCHAESMPSTTIQTDSTSADETYRELKDSFFKILSGLYGIFLVLLGAVLPIAETFVDTSRPYFFEAFYVYLYVVSMMFLLYVYAYLLRSNNQYILSLMRNITRNFRFNAEARPLSSPRDDFTSSVRESRRKIAFDESTTSRHTGSFYLRLGAVAFGIGSMIHSGLTFGHYFEITHLQDSCSEVIQAVKPLTKLMFIFFQLYFVFLNSKMCIYRFKVLARFGLMHMCGTNICVWFRSIVVETLHVINQWERQRSQLVTNTSLSHDPALKTHVQEQVIDSGSPLPELRCHWDTMMGRVVEQGAYYLYPCTIEYSLICAGILYIMWMNVGPSPGRRHFSMTETGRQEKFHRMSVDCAGSTKGLFGGLLVLVFAVICLIAFYVFINEGQLTSIASLLGHISETTVYFLATLALVFGSWRMKDMHFDHSWSGGLDQTLLLISLSGLMLYCSFSIVAAAFFYNTLDGRLTIVTNVIMLLQASGQTVFIMAGLRMTIKSPSQAVSKPGRESVTFLLICNIAMWAINTFETQKMEHNPLQVTLYGSRVWSIFTHVSVPMGIFYRFHSTVCLSNIWKKAWKRSDGYVNTETTLSVSS